MSYNTLSKYRKITCNIMGCMKSKHIQNSTEIDVFANEIQRRDSDATDVAVKPHELSDSYSFDELEKDVFKPGEDYVVYDIAGMICGRLRSVKECKNCFGQKYLSLSLITIKSNGKVFLQAPMVRSIGQFEDKKKLSDLDVRPIIPEETKSLRERGRIFTKCGLGAHYKMYSEKMILRGSLCNSQISAEGRVMVDTSSFLHFHPNYSPLGYARRYAGRNFPGEGDLGIDCVMESSSERTSIEIPEGSLHLCWPTLCGFSLKAKRWGEISVSSLSDICFSDDAFTQLVLDDELKYKLKSLVENANKDMFTDIIQGKGGGCVFLLHGPPGCGKTLTAEAVSEILHRPLYCIDVGELGITPESVEERLKKILEVAERWKAVVLIDECDIFLSRRSKDDVLRNAIVGIFLRLLEYYNGVLFLTSNRADDIDEAFESRISVSLEYGMLDQQGRKQVWSNLLDAASIQDLDIERLSSLELNGRQIKTAIRLASSLARTAGEPVRQEHFTQTFSFANTTHG